MRVAIFGGSFDPVHCEHVRFAKEAAAYLHLDKLIVMPSFVAPHKTGGAHASGEDRLALSKIAFRALPQAEISSYEIEAGQVSYSYLTCRKFAERYPDAERFFLMGEDMLATFDTWRRPEEIARLCTVAACGRGGKTPASLHSEFIAHYGRDFAEIPFTGKAVSSTELRVALAFPEEGRAALETWLDGEVLAEIARRGLYRYPAQEQALLLEKPKRRAHSYRVAKMACMRARTLGIPEEKALLAAMLHDCGKYVPENSPLLNGFRPPKDVPPPVLHQFGGAFLAEHRFGISDEEILNAIRYHTSGREGMAPLEKLIFLSDLLEEERSFSGVEELRALFYEDLDGCLLRALGEQIAYLKTTGKPIYPLTEKAYRWISEEQNAKNRC